MTARRRSGTRAGRLAGAILAAALAAAPGAGGAEGFSARLEPIYSNLSIRSTDQTGTTSTTEIDAFTQKYRLNFDKSIGPELRLSSGGVLEDRRTWISEETTSREDHATTSRLFANVNAGGPILNGAAGFDRRRQSAQATGGSSPTLIDQSLRLTVGWRPEGLPTVGIQLNHVDQYDERRSSVDRTTQDANLNAAWAPTRTVDLRYSARYARPEDHLTLTTTTELSQTARVSWSDAFLDRRATALVSYTIGTRETRTTSRAGGSGVAAQQFPTAGLSAIEEFSTPPERITLAPNPALVDGDTATGAGVNLGFSPGAAGDLRPREVGVQFADALTPVNTLYVWTSVALQEIAGFYTWTVYQSEDNVAWTPVTLVRPVSFDPFQNRFQIEVARTQARYLKVVTRPISPAATTDRRFADVFVTEVQAFLVVTASVGTVTSTTLTGALNASTAIRVLRSPALVYDSSLFMTHLEDVLDPTFFFVNGLSLNQRLSRLLGLAARVERSDAEQREGHDGQFRYNATLSADPLPQVGTALGYGGQYRQGPAGTSTSNTFTLFGRADLYEGIGTFTSASQSFGKNEAGASTRSSNVTFGTSIVPSARLTLGGSYGLTASSSTASPFVRQHRFEATSTLNPVGSVHLVAGVARFLSNTAPPNTSANLGVSWSPLAGGALQLSVGLSRSLETASRTVLQLAQAGLRWNVRPGTFFDLSYVLTDSTAPVLDTSTRALNAGLIISL